MIEKQLLRRHLPEEQISRGPVSEKQFSRVSEIIDATGFSGDGTLLQFSQIVLKGRADTPADPPNDYCVIWLDTGADTIKAKITNGSGATQTVFLGWIR